MDSSNNVLILAGGALAVVLNWLFTDIHWVLGGFWKGIMSLLYGGVGAWGAWLTKKYIISHVEKHGGVKGWFNAIVKRKNRDDEESPKL